MQARPAEETAPIYEFPEVLRNFSYDWNNDKTIAPSAAQLSVILPNLKMFESDVIEKGDVAAANEMARFQYRLGTYYLHVAKDPAAGFDALFKARTLRGWQLAWVEVQMAFAFQQRMVAANHKNDKAALAVNYNRAINFVNGVINVFSDPRECDLYPTDLLSFAHHVKALIINENKSEGYNPKVFKSVTKVPTQLVEPKPSYGFKVG